MNDQNPWVRQARPVPDYVQYSHSLDRGMLVFDQIAELVKAINTLYVQAKQGKSYLAQHQARAEMNRIFGYGNWDIIEGEPHMLYEYSEAGSGQSANKTYWITGYRAAVTVNVRDLWGMPVCTVTGTHAEQNVKLPDRGEAHAMAITSVLSYALRRALINLGDRFGLGLYNGGSTAAHGQYTIQLEPGVLMDWAQAGAAQPAAAVPAQLQLPTHETIVAEPVISDDGVNPNWVDPAAVQQPEQQQVNEAQRLQGEMRDETNGGYAPRANVAPNPGLTPQGQQQMQEFHQVREQLQDDRQQARQPEPQQQQQQQGYAQPPQQGYFYGDTPGQQQQQPQGFQPQQVQQGQYQQPQGFDPNLIAQMQGQLKVDPQEGQQNHG